MALVDLCNIFSQSLRTNIPVSDHSAREDFLLLQLLRHVVLELFFLARLREVLLLLVRHTVFLFRFVRVAMIFPSLLPPAQPRKVHEFFLTFLTVL
jgi:hypothetical protein